MLARGPMPERRSGDRRRAERRASFADVSFGDEIIGYRVQAADGYVGRVADFSIEEESWVVTGILATCRRPLPGSRYAFVPLTVIERIDAREKKIYVTPTREEVRRGSRRRARPSARERRL